MNRFFFLLVCGWGIGLALVAAADVRQVSDDLQSLSEPCEGVDFSVGSTPRPPLSAALCEMIEQGHIERLAGIAKVCHGLLLEQAEPLDLRIKFFIGQAQREEAERFDKLLAHCDDYLDVLEESTQRLTAFMEWFPVDRWDQRFGRNGFYRQVMRLNRQVEILRAVYHYYFASVGISAKRKSPDVVKELHKAARLLDQCVDDVEEGDGMVPRLWKLKVKLLLVPFEPEALSEIRPMIESLLKETLSGDQLWSLRLAALSQSHLMAREDVEQVKQQIQKTREWLKSHQESVGQVARKQLELSLFEGGLEKKGDRKESNGFLDRKIAPLKQLARDEPSLLGTIELLVGQQIERCFSKRDSHGSGRTWSAFELMSLYQYYQTKEPVNIERALEVCESFLTTISPNHSAYPEILYEKGLGHYQKMQAQEQGEPIEAAREKIKACQAWQRLAQDYPAWSLAVGVSAEAAGVLAANMAYNLFVEDPKEYGELAQAVLTTLVGHVKQGQSEPVGPLAQRRAAKTYRYYYGLVLMNQRQYQSAAQVFQAVSKQESHYGQACYQAMKCYLKLHPVETDRQRLVQALTSLVQTIDQEGDDPDLLEVVLTLAGLHLDMDGTEADPKAVVELLDYFGDYWIGLAKDDADYSTVILVRILALKQLGRLQQALEELYPALQANPTESKLWNVGLSLMQECQGPLLVQHARGKVDWVPLLEAVLPVSALVYGQVGKGTDGERVVLAGRFYLEPLSLWLLGADNEDVKTVARLNEANEIVGTLDKRAGIGQRLWFIRCRALLAFGQGDFKQSQIFWYRIRQSSSPQRQDRDIWWEARYFGLMCLYKQEGAAAVEGVIEQVLRRYPAEESQWVQRLKQFKEGLKVKK